MSKPVIGVIEWSSESGTEPVVFVADNAQKIRRAAVEMLWPMAEREEISYIDEEWCEQVPCPDLDDVAAIELWLDALREATTDAWLTIYAAERSDDADTYVDLRG